MKFIDNARDVWTHYSTIALTAASGLQGAWISIPDAIKTGLPELVGHAVSWIVFAIAMLGLFGKFVKQTPTDAP
jgi:hypothetical protein